MHAPETPARARRSNQTPDISAALLLALTAVCIARVQLDRYGNATDSPDWRIIEAADLLDAAHNKLAEAAKGAP